MNTPNTLDLEPFETRPERRYGGIDSEACLLCQRPLKRPFILWVHCVDGTIDLAAPVDMDPNEVDESGDMGWWPVGPDCAKKLPAGYVAVERSWRA